MFILHFGLKKAIWALSILLSWKKGWSLVRSSYNPSLGKKSQLAPKIAVLCNKAMQGSAWQWRRPRLGKGENRQRRKPTLFTKIGKYLKSKSAGRAELKTVDKWSRIYINFHVESLNDTFKETKFYWWEEYLSYKCKKH